ncbi:regulating synaptic membrane exocytosis protein 2 isoform X2 [Toxorhynchites rutilus septentrionalis]|uniref:regulating synaptic membrane exocytosis protein 2 isoform X2 n=1 Tax=Toxorhynchites rutilus septentrionalis TaxID=329112 RepID=UPI00247A1569|nr:regulating synaptic membrane exocytosis protein 2 isoform X2 [Toxorhynchites rutilus septentrionalis]
MLPTNVMSFMKKMVAPEDVPQQSSMESTGTFGKLKQTLSSSLLTAQDRVNKMSPRPSLIPDVEAASEASSVSQFTNKSDAPKPVGRSGSCRICLKAFKPNEFSKTCVECDQKVCEDCASYSKLEQNEVMETFRCSVCRRKMASRVFLPQESTDSILEIPVLETLQRRHSDVKLGSTLCLNVGNGTALAPPRSPELRRHSDVSPASLKELEKLKGAKATDSDWKKGHSAVPSRASSPPKHMEFETAASRIASRRPSMRMTRQRSYDDEIKSINKESAIQEPSLGLPAPMPRRKSAYDVFAPGVLASSLQSALKEPEAPTSRRPSFKIPIADNSLENEESPSPDHILQSALIVDDERRNKRRGSQLPDISALRSNQNAGNMPIYQCPALEDLEAPRRQTSLDGDAIKIVIHDVDSGPLCASKRRVILQKDPADKAHRTRGFGMRVVGGKTGTDGKLFAYIVWTVAGGPAEKGGLQQGDKILEWCGTSLVDRSFEEVCAIMDRTGDVIELLVEHATDFRMCDLLDDGTSGNPNNQSKQNSDMSNLGFTAENETIADKSPSSPTRRKLPKTPEQLAREKQVSGRVQIQVWYHGDKSELVVSLMAADNLPPRDDSLGYGGLPEAYASIKILPKTNETHVMQTEVSSPSQNPIWNATITFRAVSSDTLFDRYIEVALYDLLPQSEPIFLGECKVMLQKAFLDDVAVWYRLDDPKQLRGVPSKTHWSSPRCSISGDVTKLIRGSDYRFQRSVSDDVDSIGDGSSLLHPDHALGFSRRGSSQSETLEIESYQLGKDFSKSLPGSRRSSFQDQDKSKSGEISPAVGYNIERRRSSVAKRNTDELRRAFNQSRGEFIRTMSLSRELERKNSTT